MLQLTLQSPAIVPLTLLVWAASLAPAATGQEAQRVSVIRPGRADLVEGISLVGTLEATASADVIPRVTGYLSTLSVDVGDRVQRGDLLAQIHVPDLEAALLRAEAQARAVEAGVSQAQAGLADAEAARDEGAAQVKVAEAMRISRQAQAQMAQVQADVQGRETERARQLAEKGAVTREQLEQSEGALASAQAAVRIAQAEVQIAEARIGAARARAAAEVAAVAGAKVEVEAAAALVEAARAAATEAGTRLGFGRLVCPFEHAVVTARHLHPGAHVSADQSVVLTLMDTRVLRVVLPVPESDSVRLAVGQTVELSFRAEGSEPRRAPLARISGALDRSTRTVRVEVDLLNVDGLRPGMFCKANIQVRSAPGAITLPGGAIHTRSGLDGEPQTFVWIVQGGSAKPVPVTLGIDDGIVAEIREGLSGSEIVISAGLSGIRDGSPVEFDEGGSQ